ncbi:MAG: autotransporter-associated beta strand repeat-containing protein [Chthoniobacterales bacterium]
MPVFAVLLIGSAFAQTTYTWTPTSVNTLWNNKANWTPSTSFPNSANASAQFNDAGVGNVTVNGTFTLSGMTFLSGTNSYTFKIERVKFLNFTGSGIVNNSGNPQNFYPSLLGAFVFKNNSSAGSLVSFYNAELGDEIFMNSSNAGSAYFSNNATGSTNFLNTSSAGTATFDNFLSGTLAFSNSSTAGNAIIRNTTVGITSFSGSATADHATITNINQGWLGFLSSSTAGHAVISNTTNGTTIFAGSATADHATITAESFATISLIDSAKAGYATMSASSDGAIHFANSANAEHATLNLNGTGSSLTFRGSSTAANSTISATGADAEIKFIESSKGGTASISMSATDSLDISAHNGALSLGALMGAGDVFLGKNNLSLGSGNLDSTFSGVIHDGGDAGDIGGSLTKMGTGTFTLTGANTYTGGTTITAGTLQLGNGTTDGTISGTGKIVNNGALIFNGHSDTTIPNIISGKGSIIQQGSNTITLTNANTFTGGSSLNAGKVVLGNAKALGVAANSLSFDKGTLDLSGNSITVGKLSGIESTGTAGTIINNGANATLTANSSVNSTFTGTLQNGTGTLAFVKSGKGVLTLAGIGNNTYSGGLTLNAGGLNIASADAFGTGTFTIAGVSTIDNTSGSALSPTTNIPQSWNANFTFVGSNDLNLGTGPVNMSATRIVTVSAGSLTVGGTISGATLKVGLTKKGIGTLVLSGDNSAGYTGTTTITAGSLQVGGADGTSGNVGSGKVVDNGIFISRHSNTSTIANVISGKGSFQQNGTGKLTLTGNNTYTGGTLVNNGILAVGSATALGKGNLTLSNGTLQTNGLIHQINIGKNLTWDSEAEIALSLTNDSMTSEFVKVSGSLIADPTDSPFFFDFSANGISGGDDVLIMTVAKGFGSLDASNFTFRSDDMDLHGFFTITGKNLFFHAATAETGSGISSFADSSFIGAGSFTPAPEPATWILLSLGFASLLLIRRRLTI